MVGNDRYQDIKKSLGLVLLFIGMQFYTALKNLFVGIDLSVVIMLLSVILLWDLKRCNTLRISLPMVILFAFQSILFILAILSEKSTTQLISFHLYLLAVIFSLSTNKKYIQFNSFAKLLFWVSGFVSIVILYQATNGLSQLVLTFSGTSKLWLNQGGDPITMSRALEINFIACLFYTNKNKVEKTVAWLFIIADVIGAFSFGNRSVILCSVIVFLMWYIYYFNRKTSIKKILITIIGIVAVCVLALKIPYFSEKIKMIYESMVNGISTLLQVGGTNIDVSAKTRVNILSKMIEEFNKNPIKNFIIGLGYNYTYVDRPIFQMFFDFGIFALIIYAYYLIFIPIKNIVNQIKRNRKFYNEAFVIVTFISLQSLFDQLLTGLPYYYFMWTPAIFILFSTNNSKLRKIIECNQKYQ